jgi:outer membrane protein TolC
LALNWNVFNGLQVKRNIAQRQIGLQQAQLQQAQVQLEVQSELFTAWRNLESWKQRQVLEDDNLVAAQESFVLAQERFKLGTTNILEVKDAQRSLDEAISRSSAAKVQRKLAEIALLQVSGRLQTR